MKLGYKLVGTLFTNHSLLSTCFSVSLFLFCLTDRCPCTIFLENQNKCKPSIEACLAYEVCSNVAYFMRSPPFFKAPSLDPAFPFLKSLFLLLSFLFHPLLRYFSHPTLMQLPLALIQHTNLLYT